ncbi:damage-inducible protein DinB [Kaistella solincola]|uniref:Damage-inducible protein DinB n=1 Tax=Kaistella solincola TaxID=510955 RepID=A0ABR4ZSW2_9FLAO|nr:damage-inducible protein DinB [Kaistella solincola]KIA84589.1 damage-inducible protein DinB [Kaistella solincola]
METLPLLKQEFEQEYETTKKFLEIFPEGKNDYRPHEKSMKLMSLATHIVEIFGWPEVVMKTEKIDFAAGDYKPTILLNRKELQQKFEEVSAISREILETSKEDDLTGKWSMNMGELVLAEFDKYGAIRHALNQIVHHRAQLGVYYRLNHIPLPASYGPSADHETF